MKYFLLSLKLSGIGYLTYLFIFLVTGYDPTLPSYNPPFVIWVIDLINLFIHEAGHFFFKIFGRWIYFLGGSLFQILLPLTLVIVIYKQNFRHIILPAFWLGQSMINVSVYIQDAPFRKLRLIAKGLIHDWNWLLANNLELAEPLGMIVYVFGLIICFSGIVIGMVFSIKSFLEYNDSHYQVTQ